MKKRQEHVQRFSTFLSFSVAKERLTPTYWIADSNLERSIKQKIQEHPERTAEEWALHFLIVLQSSPAPTTVHSIRERTLAEKHLSAYLQEVCYRSAQKLQRQFQSVQYKYTLPDLFQIGNILVNQPTKLFRSFNLTYKDGSLESYASTAIHRFIGNTIYTQDLEAKREKFSDYGLLRDLSQKELREALAFSSIATVQIELHCFARSCYSAVCQPQAKQSSRKLEAPSQEDLVQVAACYNHQFSQLTTVAQLADANAIQAMLSTCIRAAREYRTNRVQSLLSDDVISDPMLTPWESAIQIEEREQVNALVAQVFATIPETGQTLLKLWLGLNLTQSEIAAVLKQKYPELQKQYQVARHLSKYNRHSLKEFLQQCRQLNPNLPLHDDKEIERIQESLAECLRLHCKRLVYADLERLSQQYGNEDELGIVANSIRVEQAAQASQCVDSNLVLIQAFEHQLEQNLSLLPGSFGSVSKKIVEAVSDWLDYVSQAGE